jgi:hypothetical protein
VRCSLPSYIDTAQAASDKRLSGFERSDIGIAGQISRKARRSLCSRDYIIALTGGAMAFALSELLGVAASLWPRAWLELFGMNEQLLQRQGGRYDYW